MAAQNEQQFERARDRLRRLRSGPKTLSPEAMIEAMMQPQAFSIGSMAAVPPPIRQQQQRGGDAASKSTAHAPPQGNKSVYVLSAQSGSQNSMVGSSRSIITEVIANNSGSLDIGAASSLHPSEHTIQLPTSTGQSGVPPSLEALNKAAAFSNPTFNSSQGKVAKSPFMDSAAALQAASAKVSPKLPQCKALENVSKSSEPSVKSLDLNSGKCAEDSLSTGSDPGRLEPTKIYDKYAALKEAAGTSDDTSDSLESHLSAWKRVLEAAQSTLRHCTDLFLKSSDANVCRAVVQTEKGAGYISAIAEVYRVACRIKVSLKTTTFQTDFLLDLMGNIEDSWQTIVNCTGCHPALQSVSSVDLSSALAASNCTDPENFCGICLLRVEFSTKEQGTGLNSCKIEFAGRKYHGQCANFWVNKVNPVLPSLTLPSKLL